MRFKGYKPSPPDAVGLGHPHHLKAIVLPDEAHLELPPALDQGPVGSCTGNSSAVAICHAMASALGMAPGQFPELPSRLFLYYNARAEEGTTATDDGAMLSDVFDMASKLGVCRETCWPYFPDGSSNFDAIDAVTKQPTWGAYRAAADQRIVQGAWRITTFDDERIQDVRSALAAGAVVVHGSQIDDAYENMQPGAVWDGLTGPSAGGHAILLHGYKKDPHFGFIFDDRSSWGSGFANNGSTLISSRAVIQADELWVVQVAPTYSEAT